LEARLAERRQILLAQPLRDPRETKALADFFGKIGCGGKSRVHISLEISYFKVKL
jgi:hypothetical protein